MTSNLYILLPVHNRVEITKRFLQCLSAQSLRDFHLVLVDDGSTDGTERMARGFFPSASVIRGSGRWWWAGCLQQGYRWLEKNCVSDDAIVLIINDDTVFAPDFLELGVTILVRNPGSLLLARVKDEISGKVRESGVHADLKHLRFNIASNGQTINCLSTRGLFLKWGDMQRIGKFHPRLLPHYWSDYEYTMRGYRKGYKCITDPTVVLTANETTTGNRYLNEITGWQYARTLFSPKTIANPLYMTAFVILAVPMIWGITHLVRIWAQTAKNLLVRTLCSR